MNPWGFVVIGLGVLAIIIGVTGSYDAVKSAITGKANAKTTSVNKSPGAPVTVTLPPGAKKTPTGTMV